MAKRRNRKGRSDDEKRPAGKPGADADTTSDDLVVEPMDEPAPSDGPGEGTTEEPAEADVVRPATAEEEAALPVVELPAEEPAEGGGAPGPRKRRVAKTMIGIPLAEQLAAKEDPPAEEPPAEEPAAEETAAEETAAEEPPAEEPPAEEPAAEEPVAQERVEEEPAAEEPVAQEPVEEEPAAEEAAAPEEAAEEAAPEEAAEKPAAEEEPAAAEAPAAEEPADEGAEEAEVERSSVIEMKAPDSPEFSLLERSVLVEAPAEDVADDDADDGLSKGQRALRRLSPRLLGLVLLLLGGAGVAGTFLTMLNPFRDWFMHLLMYSVIFAFFLLYLKAHGRRRPVARYVMMIITVALAGFFGWILTDYIPAQKVFYARSVLWREAIPELWLPIGLLLGAALFLFVHCVFIARHAPRR